MDRIAMIMAAGEGVRMASSTPKMLHQICGIPMVEHVMRALDSVCREQIMIVGSNRDKIISNYKGRVDFVQQAAGGHGTGWAVLSAARRLERRRGVVLITAGDKPLVRSETFARLISEVEIGRCAAAVLTAHVERPFGFNRVIRENGRVKAIVDQHDLRPEQLNITEVSASVYAFDIEKLRGALSRLHCGADGDHHLSELIGLMSADGEAVTTVPVLDKGEGMGVNDRIQLAEADRLMRVRINNWHMRQGVTMIDPERVYIQPDVMIGRDTVIHPGCEIGRGSIIGERCVIRAGCQIAFSHIGDGCVIGNSVVRNAVLGAGVRLEHNAAIGVTLPDGASPEPFAALRGEKK